jgi:hypothetical protein
MNNVPRNTQYAIHSMLYAIRSMLYATRYTLSVIRSTLHAISNTKDYVRNYERKMQNKANVKDAEMNVSSFITIKYVKLDTCLNRKNKPNSNPIKAKTNPIKANFNAYQTQFKPNPSGLRCLLRNCRTDQSQFQTLPCKNGSSRISTVEVVCFRM